MSTKTLRTCEKGHTYYKSTDCPSCPTCDKENIPTDGFLARLSNPARNALIHEGITTIEQLATYTEKDILKIHGIGKASLPAFHQSLKEAGLTFKA